MNVCICDDNIIHLHHTEEIVNEYLAGREIETKSFSSSEALLRQINENSYFPDIAVLDIEMPGMNGIELAKELNRLVPTCCVIFLTGHMELCCEVYSSEHIFFVMKDRATEYMGAALDKAIASLESLSAEYIYFNIRGSTVAFPPDKIIYVESSLRKLIVHTSDNIFEAYGKLDNLNGEAASENLVRCHQSFLVNLKYVLGIEKSSFMLSSGERIPISRSRLQSSKTKFLSRQFRNPET